MNYFRWIFVIYYAGVYGQTSPVVTTSVGKIIGLRDDFTKFLGIPYAVVDSRDPFGPAKPHPPFQTPYHATKEPVVCPQISKGILQGSIQCLHLNVYKPNNDYQNNTLPVIVFIHGGAFKEGDGNLETYSPIFLIQKGVIVVTLNYRLGPYGFLCVEKDEYNNQGLKDQILALKWIKKYINQFGGDEENIVLMGHSAGSASVDFLVSFNEDRLFHKVILQSALMVSPLMTEEPKTHKYLTNVAAKLGINSKNLNTVDVIKELSKINPMVVISAIKADNFRPCVNNSVIKDNPKRILKNLKIIIGNTMKEMIFFYNGVKNFTNMIHNEIKKHFVNIPQEGLDAARNFYLTGNVEDSTIDFGCDFFFNYPTERTVRHFLRSNATVYRYIFSFDGGRNYIKTRDNIYGKGATHGDDLGYLFDAGLLEDIIFDEDQRVIDTMTNLWTDFAKYGDPTPEHLMSKTWLQVDHDEEHCMLIGAAPMLVRRYREESVAFWDSFYKNFGEFATGLRFAEESFTRNTAPKIGGILGLVVILALLRLYY